MTIQQSPLLRAALGNAFKNTFGVSPTLNIYDNSAGLPSDTSTTPPGVLLATITLPSTWLAINSGVAGEFDIAGTWSGTAIASGIAGYYRLNCATGDNAGAVMEQGTCGMTGTSSDMIMDNTNIATGQNVTVAAFTRVFGFE